MSGHSYDVHLRQNLSSSYGGNVQIVQIETLPINHRSYCSKWTLQSALEAKHSLHASCQKCEAHASLIRIISTFYYQQHLQRILWPGILSHTGILIPSDAKSPGCGWPVRCERLSLITSFPCLEPGQTRICKLIIRNCQYYYRIYQTLSEIKIW